MPLPAASTIAASGIEAGGVEAGGVGAIEVGAGGVEADGVGAGGGVEGSSEDMRQLLPMDGRCCHAALALASPSGEHAGMDAFPFAVVGFDLDGTLLDTSGDLAAAVDDALVSAGRPPLGVDAIRPMIGGGSRHMLAQGMQATGGCTDAELDRLTARLLAHYEANIAVHTQPFPGMLDALDALAARGVTIGIMTNKVEHLAVKLLDALGLSARFAAVVGGDTVGKGKPAPEPILEMVRRCEEVGGGGGRAAFVGDSIYDIEGAHNAGLPAVAVSFGFLQQPVATLGADAVIDRYDELLPALERLGAR